MTFSLSSMIQSDTYLFFDLITGIMIRIDKFFSIISKLLESIL